MVTVELIAPSLTAEDVSFACFTIGQIADHFDEELQKVFGGSIMFGEDKPEPPMTSGGYL